MFQQLIHSSQLHFPCKNGFGMLQSPKCTLEAIKSYKKQLFSHKMRDREERKEIKIFMYETLRQDDKNNEST